MKQWTMCRVMDYKNSKKNSIKPPYEEVIDTWHPHVQHYGAASLFAIPRSDRTKWMNHPFLSGFRVFSCGYYERAVGHSWERKNLDEAILIYCIKGKGYYEYKNRTLTIGAGDVLYCFPKTHHRYYADQDDPWTLYWMHISGNSLAQYEKLMGITKQEPVIHLGLYNEAINLFRSLLQNYQPIPNEQQWLASTICAQHILAYISATPRQKPSMIGHTQEMQSLIDYMQKSVNAHISLDEFAARVDMSPSHLCKVFRGFTGQTPIDYFNRMKIRHACSLLATSKMTMQQIADNLGIDDPYYFSRLFKKIMGLSPKHYRQATELVR